jgi:predicted nucleotidyltransferase
MLNEDYRDMLQALSDEKVRFLLVGAYALAAHGYPRATMDIDIWIMPSPKNADAVLRALRRFGAPLHNLTKEDLQRDGTIFQIGVAPRRIDIITAASGLYFEDAYERSLSVNIEGIEVHIPSIEDLIRNKRATGRTKDLADAEALESLRNSERIRIDRESEANHDIIL